MTDRLDAKQAIKIYLLSCFIFSRLDRSFSSSVVGEDFSRLCPDLRLLFCLESGLEFCPPTKENVFKRKISHK